MKWFTTEVQMGQYERYVQRNMITTQACSKSSKKKKE